MSYNCEHSNINSTLKDFKYSVLKPVKFYNKVKTLPEYSNISYSQFKARNVSFDIFEAAFLRVSNDTVINDSQLEHIFEYLINNIKVSSDTNIKKIVKRIKKLILTSHLWRFYFILMVFLVDYF